MLEIVKIIAENVSMIHARTELIFRDGMTLVDGKNGVGKSTINRLIRYALTEKADCAIENRFTSNNHRVSLYLKDTSGSIYEIHHFKKYKEFKNTEDKYLNEFKTRNDDIIYLRNKINYTLNNDKKGTLALFQKDISFNENVFEYVNLMGGSMKYLPELTDGEIKKKFDEIITVFEDINGFQEKAGKFYIEYNKKYNDYLDNKKELETTIDIYKKNKSDKEVDIENEKEKIKQRKLDNENTINILRTEITEQENIIEKEKIKIPGLEEKFISLKQALDKIKKEKEEFSEVVSNFSKTRVILVDTPEIINLKKEINNIELKMSEINGGLKFTKKNIEAFKTQVDNPYCPTCGHEISVEQQKQKLKELEAEAKKTQAELKSLEADVNLKNRELEAFYLKIQEDQREIDLKHNEELKELKLKYQSKDQEYTNKYEETAKIRLEFLEIKEKVKTIEARIALLEEKIKNLDNVGNDVLNSLYEDLDKISSHLQDLITNHKKISNYCERYYSLIMHITWIKDVLLSNKGLKTTILQNLANKMTVIANETFKKYFGNDIEISINTHRELARKDKDTGLPELKECYNIGVVNKNGADSFSGLSTGEKQMVNVCCIEAFGVLCRTFGKISLNFLYGDETFTGLKGLNIERMINYLDQKPFKVKLVTSHNDDVKEFFENILFVEKDTKGSKYRYV